MANVCGTGGWDGPKPGDPDNNSVLSAVSAFGGIDVSWSYPVTNPYAVAHTILHRGITNNYANSVQRVIVAGNNYYDKTDSAATANFTYYYWIQIVSVNGTVGAAIGPASAVARPTITQTLELLSGKIDSGILATSLRTTLGQIDTLGGSIQNEISNRLAGDVAYNSALTGVQNNTNSAITLIGNETNARISANDALINQIDLVATGFEESIAGVSKEIVIATGPDSALAKKVDTVTATVKGSTVTGEVGLVTKVDDVTKTVSGMYTAKVQVNGLIGGFGLSNDGKTVEAGFDVDRFWVGKAYEEAWELGKDYPIKSLVVFAGYAWECLVAHTSSAWAMPPDAVAYPDNLGNGYWIRRAKRNVKPFIIENDEVFMNKAVINQLTFSKIRNESGSIIGTPDGKIKATFLEAQSAVIKNDAGTIVLADGDGKFSGSLFAAGGTFSGKLTADAIDAVTSANIKDLSVTTLKIGANEVTVPDYVSQPTSDVTLRYVLTGVPGEKYKVFILGSLVQSFDSQIVLTINGVLKWAESPIRGTLATRGYVVELAVGIHDIRLYSTNAGNTNGTTIYALATKR